jgi:uncharacterized oxidoreductase
MQTKGNTVFITGGSAGIGLAIAKKLISEGNQVIINGRNQERLDNALKELSGAIGIQGDFALESDRIRIAEELQKNYPDVNIIINNAGAAFGYLLSDEINALEKAQIEMNLNYFAIIHFNELMIPHLLQKNEAAVVNISSLAVYGSHKFLPTYGATKAALHSYTVALRYTYEEQKSLQIYEVYPPLTNTEFSSYVGGENGIPASEVAEELFLGLEKDQFDIPVGEVKKYASAVGEAMAKLTAQEGNS